ncbi:ABC transporter ATP-binding protein [Rhizobium sp. FKL33]|uniref:ABC transporter ATP-binding protein n=1 Tax=Rhizobium sp. FKL33 TaxID=2562307 RepID=UPI0010BF842E|nr:ABC transporter ATP-binding protein [Rhizobium sp. FKL33]
MTALLEARGIYKTYPGGTVANQDVDLTILPGEVHAVVGENGAGKSTLMKILFGIEQPDRGSLMIEGRPVVFPNPNAAIAAGVGMVFQHFSLVPSFSVYENVVMGSEPKRGLRFDRKRAIADVRALSEKFRLAVDPLPPVGSIPVGQQQRVEILKALYRDARILILDEPTAVLAPQEVEELFAAVRSLVAQGRTVIFIAHKLPEVLEISDRITVMRAGRTVAQVKTKDVTEKELATLLVGRDVALKVDRAVTTKQKTVLEVAGVTVTKENGKPACKNIDFRLRAGEIVGLVGIEGNGQQELMEAIAGLRPAETGSVLIEEENILDLSIKARRAAGLAHIPQDRIAEGLAVGASLGENMVATRLDDPNYSRHGVLNLKAIDKNARALIEKFAIRAAGPDAAAGTLSGGNMQKVVVARELLDQPKALLVSQPTRGVDLGATQFIWKTITEARDHGAGVLLSSADLSELMALSDRFLVFYHGEIVAALDNNEDVTSTMLGSFMLGLERQSAADIKAGSL